MLKATSYVQFCGLKFDVNNNKKSAARLFSQILMVSLQATKHLSFMETSEGWELRTMLNSGEETREKVFEKQNKTYKPLHPSTTVAWKTIKSKIGLPEVWIFHGFIKNQIVKLMWSRRRSSANVPLALLVTRYALLRAQLGHSFRRKTARTRTRN